MKKNLLSFLFAIVAVFGLAQSNHTVTFTGNSTDFNAAEKYTAAANNTDYYITFDANYLYIGAFRTGGNTFGSTDNLAIYLDTDPFATPTGGTGTTTGQSYNSVTGTLPFTANYNVHVEQSYCEARSFGSSWASTITTPTSFTSTTAREVKIALSTIGNPNNLYITCWMGYAGGMYSNAPGTNVAASGNPTIMGYFGNIALKSGVTPITAVNTPITPIYLNNFPAGSATTTDTETPTNLDSNLTTTGWTNKNGTGSFVVANGNGNVASSLAVSSINNTPYTLTLNVANGYTMSVTSFNLWRYSSQANNTISSITINGITITSGSISIPTGANASSGTTLGQTAVANAVSGLTGTVTVTINLVNGGSTGSFRLDDFTLYGVVASIPTSPPTISSIPASPNDGTATNAYVGSTVTVTGTGFTGVTSVKVGGSGGTTVTGTIVNDTTLTFTMPAGASGQVYVLNSAGNATSSSSLTNLGYITTATGTWQTNATWLGGAIPSGTNPNVTIANNVTATTGSNGSATTISVGKLTVNSGITLTNSSTITLNVNTNSTNSGTITNNGTLNFLQTYTNAGTINNTVTTGTLTIAATLTNSGTFNNNGTFQINGGNIATNAPVYGGSSILAYNTGGAYNVSTEWNNWTSGTTVTPVAGAGIPFSVNIMSGTLSSTANNKALGGTMTISSGATLSLGADLYVAGSWNDAGTFTPNSKAVFFSGTGTQTITDTNAANSNTETFAYLINNSTGTLKLGSNVTVNATSGDVLQLINTANLDVASKTLTLAGTGGNILTTGAARSIISSVTGGVLNITGNVGSISKTVTSTSSGSLVLGTTANPTFLTTNLATGFDCGTGNLTLVNSILQMSSNGYIENNSPKYSNTSTLTYNGVTGYGVYKEWTVSTGTIGTTAGYPQNVTLTSSTVNMPNNDRGLAGILTLGATNSALTLNASSGNLFIGGNLVNNIGTAGLVNNGRTVNFNGGVAQTITGATNFDNLTLNNSTGLTLGTSSPVTVNNLLTLTSGKITLGANNLTIGSSGSISGGSSTNYVVTASTGQLKETVSSSNTVFPVGNSAYNPITLNNSGTSDVIGINVLDGTYATPLQTTKIVNRRWQITESVANGSNLSVVAQYNSGETASAFATGIDPFIGFYDGGSWTQTVATSAGTSPDTFTSTANLDLSGKDLTTGTKYIALGKDDAFLSTPYKLVITSISPTSPTAGVGFSVTVQVQSKYGSVVNAVSATSFSLTTNGNAGAISGTTTGTITAGSSSVVVSGVILPTAGTGVTLTATRTSGDNLQAGTSSTFNVLQPASQLAFVGVPGTGNVSTNLTSFTVEARRPDGTVDTSYTGNITLAKVTGSGTMSGTLTVAAVNGVATYTDIQFNDADTYTITATSGSLTSATSGNIVITYSAVSLGTYPFTGTASSSGPAARLVASSVVSNIAFSSVSVNTLTINASSGNDDNVLSVMPNTGNFGTALNAGMYVEFTVTPSLGYYLQPSSITFLVQRTSAGATNYSVRSSIDNYASDIGTGSVSTSYVSKSVTLSGSTSDAITYRIYPYGGSNTGFFRIDDITFNGIVQCVKPSQFTVTGGGNYCVGGSGIAVGLSGSQKGIKYQLKDGSNANVGNAVDGTGSAISFGNITTAGTYTVYAYNTYGSCNYNATMTGSATVMVNARPTAVVSGATSICSGSIATVSVALTGTGPWNLTYSDGTNSTNVTNIATSPYTFNVSPTVNTTYTVTAVSDANCTAQGGDMTGSAAITINPNATAGTISGASTLLIGSTSAYSVSGNSSAGTWSVSNSGSSSTIDSSGNLTAGATNGTATITYTVNSGCGTPIATTYNVTITDTTTWNGASWDLGAPNSSIKAIINGSYTTSGGGLTTNTLNVHDGNSISVTSGNPLTIVNGINTNTSGNIIVQSGASLLQTNDSATNTGNITVKRNLTYSSGRTQYNYMISPTVGFNLKNMYPEITTPTATNPYTLYYNEATDRFGNSSGAYIAGRGLAVKEPAATYVSASNSDAVFTGVPFNGALSYNLAFTDASHGYNLVGNPYPSNLDVEKVYAANGSSISSSFYFWDNSTNSQTSQMGSSYNGNNYATYNAASHTYTSATSSSKVPSKYVSVAQGFIVQATASGKAISFNNSMRTDAAAGANFFGKNQTVYDRYWINLTSPSNIVNDMAVVYLNGGNNAFAQDDSKILSLTSDAIYSLAGTEKVLINGRNSFVDTDVVPLGTNHFVAGNYTFSIPNKEGIFATGQDIYLKDLLLGTITNLSNNNYTFAANAGQITGRFEIVYIPSGTLATANTNAQDLQVYRNAGSFVIKSAGKAITNIEVYDLSGRLIKSVKANDKSVTLDSADMVDGAYVFKINRNGDIATKKVMK